MNIVLFTQRVEVIESYNERRDCADQRISEFISACGFLPVPLPNQKEIVQNLITVWKPKGIVLTGGNSLVKYGGIAPERDDVDSILIKLAIQKKIPLYGFCRGMQSIIDYFGGTLVNVKHHVAVKHTVNGVIQREVNSFHNQACLELEENTGLMVMAKTEDGVIEAVCHKEYPIFGTMWHPERETPFKESDIDLVRNLFLKGE